MANEELNKNYQIIIFKSLKKNFKSLIALSALLVVTLFGYLIYNDLQKKNEIKLSEKYTQATVQLKQKKKEESKLLLEGIIDEGHKFYSPLALYYIIDNNLENDPLKIINFFDKILKIRSIEKENLNLIKIKKAIFLFSRNDEELIIKTLNPIVNSDSVWRDMAINLLSDYFLSKDQEKKANEYIKLLNSKTKK
jgi:predicted negative regulator of RcsB-dependent stress response